MTDDVPLTRRDFVRLSAATAGALTLTTHATAEVTHEKMDVEYQFVQSHTPDGYAVPTLVTFSDSAGFAALESLGVETVTTETPQPAAYAPLTATEAQLAAEIPTAETLSHSPGSNPFWRLGYYPLGVFPAPRRATGFVDYEQMVSGLEHLQREHEDRLNFYSIGRSPGHYNYVTDRDDPKDIYVAEVTNDVHDEASFQEKEQVFLSLSLHGLERAGVEAGTRFVEELLTGREAEMEALLDDVVFVFVFSNPDGWVAKHPQYDSGWQLTGPDGAPVIPFYERGNAGVFDTNRHYPIAGWITTAHYPGEPNGTPERSASRVPDTVDIVRHFRDSDRYQNLNYGADLHGALNASAFVLGLISQDQFDAEQQHELDQMNVFVDEALEESLSTFQDAAPVTSQAAGQVPEQAFDWAGIWDTLGYTDSGFMGDWMAHPPIRDPETDEVIGGGLGLTSMDFEMAFSHMVGANVFNPELVRMQVVGYQAAIRAIATYAVQASETPNTDDEFRVDIETGGDGVAYVTSDTVERSSEDLEFARTETANTSTTTDPLAVGESTTVTKTVEAGLHSLTVHAHTHDAVFDVALVSPSGEQVTSFDAIGDDGRVGGKCCGHPDMYVRDPQPGEWTVELTNAVGETAPAAVQFATLAAEGGNPDPLPALGYEQNPYRTTPFSYFEELNPYVRDGGHFDPVSIGSVTRGLLDGYDHAVVVHDDGIDDPSYVRELEEFLERGGNLVLTDSGVNLLSVLDTALVSGVSSEDVSRETFYIANLAEKNLEHPLLRNETDAEGADATVRPIQKSLWKIVPLGYSTDDEAPMHLVDETAFTDLGGTVAGRTNGQVSAGSITGGDGTGVHVISSLLPPASQQNLHPFGLLDYAVSFLGSLLLTNALGFKQLRRTADGTVRYGRDEWDVGGAVGGTLSASGSRTDDGTVYQGGQAVQVDITVSELSKAAEITDTLPESWAWVDGDGTPEGTTVTFGGVTPDETPVTFTYFAEAAESAGQYTLGPAAAVAGEERVTFGGTDDNVVVAAPSAPAETTESLLGDD